VLDGGKAEALFITVYRGFITLPSANKSYHQLFAEHSNTDGQPALFHCTTGKDRTGWAAAALLTVLGDCRSSGFIRTISRALITSSPLISRLLTGSLQPVATRTSLGPCPRQGRIPRCDFRRGANRVSIEAYFADGLGIDKAGQRSVSGWAIGDCAPCSKAIWLVGRCSDLLAAPGITWSRAPTRC
jgi:protein-tyrosine phosphatase